MPRDPYVHGHPATGLRSLIGRGTPKNGGRSATSLVATTSAARLARAAHLVVGAMAERVERPVELVDALEVEVRHLDGADLLAADGGGELDGWSEGIHAP